MVQVFASNAYGYIQWTVHKGPLKFVIDAVVLFTIANDTYRTSAERL